MEKASWTQVLKTAFYDFNLNLPFASLLLCVLWKKKPDCLLSDLIVIQ